MTGPAQNEFPDGVLVSSDAGTPSALDWGEALEAIEFPAALDLVAGFAAGPLGAAGLRARRPVADAVWIARELMRVSEVATLARAGRGLVAEAVPALDDALGRLRIGGSVLDGAELLAVRRSLTAARLVLAELRRVAEEAPRTAELACDPPDRSLERRLELAIDDEGELLDSASPALAAARSDVRTARDRLVQRLEAILRGLGGEGGVTLRDGRYVIPVPRDLRGRPEGIIHGESASGATLFIEPGSVIPLGNALREAQAAADREALRVMRDLTDLLRPHHQPLRALHAMCVAVDDLAARGRYAAEVDGHAPVVAPAPAELRIVNGRHPLLLAGDRGGVVPFDLSLAGAERTVLLSGPNTGGKSVLLKAAGLFAALAQSGIVPPLGPGSALPVFTRCYADIGDRQSIAASLSTFSAHVALLRQVLDGADEAALVLLDEIGSGTDPAEGSALAGAVLGSLTRRGSVTLATTHLGALKRLAAESPGIVNASLQFDAATLTPTYRLLKGMPGRSYGLAIARRLGLPDDVLADAEAQVPAAERSLDALLAAVEERERRQQAHEAELAGRQVDSELLAARLEAQAAAQAEREARLRQREREAERAGREQARSYLLEARDTVERAVADVRAAVDEEKLREARRVVEQAAAAEAAALKRLDAAERPAGAAGAGAGGLAAGQRVRLQSGSAGEVLELRTDGKAIVRVGSLKLVVDPATLTLLPPAGGRRPAAPKGPAVDAEATFEIDLRGMTGDEAEDVVLRAIDAAVMAEQPYLRIIHGKGTGAVRERVQQVVRRDRRVKGHAFAPPAQGGAGVTIVEFAG